MRQVFVEGSVIEDHPTGASYLVGPIWRACELLKAFRTAEETLPLRELVSRTKLNKTTVFRAAQTLVAGGMLERVAGDRYRSLIIRRPVREFRIGYAGMTSNSLLSGEISDSLRLAASRSGIELVELNNQLSARVAIRNSERLVQDRVDLAIEFQVHQGIAASIASNFAAARIPLIAIHTPHPGAVFFGGNNYLAGRIAGRALGRWATSVWEGKVDSVLLLGHSGAGPVTQSRLTGTAAGMGEVLKDFEAANVTSVDTKGGYAETLDMVLKYLSSSRATRILVGAINDSVALGAIRAFAEADRSEHCAVVGQNGTVAARAELRKPHSRLIASVGFFPEKYGEQLLSLALDMLHRRSVPPAVFVKHALITRQNVDEHYPGDAFALVPDTNSLLFNRFH